MKITIDIVEKNNAQFVANALLAVYFEHFVDRPDKQTVYGPDGSTLTVSK